MTENKPTTELNELHKMSKEELRTERSILQECLSGRLTTSERTYKTSRRCLVERYISIRGVLGEPERVV